VRGGRLLQVRTSSDDRARSRKRGARNKLLLLGEAEKRKGVIAASAGNHALHWRGMGRDLRIPVTVVMPKWAPLIKVANCRSFGRERHLLRRVVR
jgi:threonine dehydratase